MTTFAALAGWSAVIAAGPNVLGADLLGGSAAVLGRPGVRLLDHDLRISGWNA